MSAEDARWTLALICVLIIKRGELTCNNVCLNQIGAQVTLSVSCAPINY